VENVEKQCGMRTNGSSRAKRDDNAAALPAGRGETESIQHGPPLLKWNLLKILKAKNKVVPGI
jgi:hypothetical protein